MAYSHFDKFKAFFLALNISNYHPEIMDPKIITPQDKAYCFNWLLKEIPELKGKNNYDLIEFLRDPRKVKASIAGQFAKGEGAELTKALEEKPIATEGIVYQQGQVPVDQPAPVASSGGGGGMPSMPWIPSSGSMPRVHIVPQTTKEEEEATETQTEQIIEPQTTPHSPQAPSRDSTATKQVESTPTPSSSRKINSSFVRSSFSSGFRKVQNLASPANPFLKTNLNRLGSGLKNMFGNAANLGGRAGLGAINHGGNFFNNFKVNKSRLTSNLKGARSRVSSLGSAKKFALGFGVFSIIFFMIALGGMMSTSSTGEAAPIPGSTSSLDYTLPLKNPAVLPLDIRAQVKAAFPGAKIEYWDKIIQQSQAANFNPALALALWIEETGASQTTYIRNGGSEIPVNGSLSKGHLGCAPWEDQTIDESLTCLFKFAAKYTDAQFAEFMAAYSGGPAGSPFSNNPNFPGNIKLWYSRLVPSGVGAITAVNTHAGNFNVDISALPASYQQWAQEALNTSAIVAPRFKDRLNAAGNTTVVTTSGGSHTSGTTVYIRTGYDVNFFKQILIHELGHRIKGSAGTTSPICNGQTIESIESEGYLTYYAENATPAQVTSPACGSNDQITRSDEDFGESVSYYINNGMGELNYGSGCSTYNSVNPYARSDRPSHRAYIQCLLGP